MNQYTHENISKMQRNDIIIAIRGLLHEVTGTS